jgi:hypothetical protein
MWEPRHLTTLWTSTACYRDSFTFYTVYIELRDPGDEIYDSTLLLLYEDVYGSGGLVPRIPNLGTG